MPWQPYTPDTGHKKTRRDSHVECVSQVGLSQCDGSLYNVWQAGIRGQENGVTSPAKHHQSPGDPAERAERRVKEKSSYKKLISNLQSTYQDLTQEQALRGILALRVENNGTLSGMTMLEITEGVIRFVKSNYNTSDQEERPASRNIISDDADGENSSLDDPDHGSERRLQIVESDGSNTGERRTEAEILRIPLVRQKKALAKGTAASSSESEGDDSSDDSYSPETAAIRKRSSPKKKESHDQSAGKTSQRPKSPRKKIEKVNLRLLNESYNWELQVQLSVEDIEAEYPKICRKRRFPSHFHEFSLPHPEPEDPDVSLI